MNTAPQKTYQIVEFRAENIKRLTAVAIKPTGEIVEITGENEAGKTSILDAIWWCLAGERAIQEDPIRKGEEHAIIQTDLGDLLVTRRFTRQDKSVKGKNYSTSLQVENAEGALFKKPQDILNALLGALTFDPLDFLRMKPEEQMTTLRAFVANVDFDAVDQANDKDYAARTEANRAAEQYKAQAAGIVVPVVEGEPVDEDGLLNELQAAGESNTERERIIAERTQSARSIARYREEVTVLEARANELRKQAAELDRQATKAEGSAMEIEQSLADAPDIPEATDIAPLRVKLTEARSLNARIRAAKEAEESKSKLLASADKSVTQADTLTKQMADRKRQVEATVAKSDMPVKGLSFGDKMVMLDDLPFSQAADAVQLRTSIAIAMAQNPKLRVIRIRDGSLLSTKSMQLLADMAKDRGYQCWVETVESVRPGAIVIEDGHVAGVVGEESAAEAGDKPKDAML